MSGKKKILMALLLVILLGATAVGVVWNMTHYIMIDFRFYPRNAQELDLRDREISVRHYEKICRRLPECEVFWNVPVQGVYHPETVHKITLDAVTDADIHAIQYLPELRTVSARGCKDYPQLLKLQERYPELEVVYTVELDGRLYAQNATKVVFSDVSREEIGLLPYLPKLEQVHVRPGQDAGVVTELQSHCRDRELTFCVLFGDNAWPDSTTQLEVSGVTEEELALLQFLPALKTVHFAEPQASAPTLVGLKNQYPKVTFTWEKTVYGICISSEDTEVDISGAPVADVAEVEAAMAYFPNAEKLIMSDCGIENEEMAQLRERHRQDYKVVWTVSCGKKLRVRTDATTFMPVREHVYYLNNDEAYNLRYCEDMIAVDIGHMSVSDISFVAFMPNLKYLILAHTQVQYIDPISSCKNLVFLELDWSPVRDFTPLIGCTALEDINIGNTFASVDPLCQMPWLKNVWMIGRGSRGAWTLSQALPDTKVQAAGDATVASGWRSLPNYYDMRDVLGMFYMSW